MSIIVTFTDADADIFISNLLFCKTAANIICCFKCILWFI